MALTLMLAQTKRRQKLYVARGMGTVRSSPSE